MITEYYSRYINQLQDEHVESLKKLIELTMKLKEMTDKKNFWHHEWELELAYAKHAEERIEELEKENKRLAEYEYMYKELCR